MNWGLAKVVIVAVCAAAGVVTGQIIGHSTIALLIGVIVGLGATIVKDLWKRWQQRIVEHTDRAIVRAISGFDHRYRSFVLSHMRFVETKGLTTIGPYAPEFDEVFVDVSLAYRAPHEVPEDILAEVPSDVTERHTIWDFVSQSTPRILAVVGVPGSGKTTLLRHTARHVCRERHGRKRTVPLLLYLRDHAATIAENPDVSLPTLLRNHLAPYRVHEPDGWFEKRLRLGRCLVLLDGLDEVGRLADRLNVSEWVERQTEQYPLNDFIITSRPQGYRTAPIRGATVLQIRSFTNQQVRTLVHTWYQAVERRSTGTSGPDVQMRAEAEAADLLDRLNAAPGLYDLTVNPLLLTMITNVHRFRGALPGSRVDLYGEMCQVMLWRRQEAKKLPTELTGEKKENLLRRLAYAMMEQEVRDLARDDVLAEFKPALSRMSTRLSAEDFLADVGSNGLLIERESGLYSFAHLTFQEYLASCFIRDQGLGLQLAERVDDIWWRETTILYAARANADPIVSACIETASATSLSLAFECVGEDSEIDPIIRSQLDALLASALLPDFDPEHRRLVSRVLLSRYLRHMSRASSGGRVCVHPISSIIFNLFCLEYGVRPTERPYLSRLDLYSPAIGMRGIDAVNFVGWVNGITAGDPGCRLPYGGELDDPIVAHARTRATVAPVAPAWLEPEEAGRPPRLWAAVDTSHPHLVTGSRLVEHLSRDFRRTRPIMTRVLLLHSILCNLHLGGDRISTFRRAIGYVDPFNELDNYLSRAFDQVIEFVFDPAKQAKYQASSEQQIRSLTLAMAIADVLDKADDSESGHWQLVASAVPIAQVLSTSLVPIPDLGLVRKLDQTLDLDRVRIRHLVASAKGVTLAHIIGAAMAHTVRLALSESPVIDWDLTFCLKFSAVTGCTDWSAVISFDELTDRLLGARHNLQILVLGTAVGDPRDPYANTPPSDRWPIRVVDQLVTIAKPIFDRDRPITADDATVIRVAALSLAAEADLYSSNAVGDEFRYVAAGATLLEGRMNGERPPLETIVLASE